MQQNLRIIIFILIIGFAPFGTAFANGENSKPETQSEQLNYLKVGGMATMAIGGLASLYGFIAIVGPPAGGDPCKVEGESARREGETSDKCWERVDKNSEQEKKRGQYILPIGLGVTGIGCYLFYRGTDQNTTSLQLRTSDDNIALVFRRNF